MNDIDVTDAHKLCRVVIRVQIQQSYKIMSVNYLYLNIHQEAAKNPIKINNQA